MKKVVVVLGIILVIGGFVVFQKMQSPSQTTSPENTLPTAVPTGTQVEKGMYKDGVYTGTVGSASQFGDVQVKITVTNGKIANVDVLKFPDTPGNTTDISNKTLPILKEETITAQSAKIDNVTGATQTWEGFVQSLQSALDQAKV